MKTRLFAIMFAVMMFVGVNASTSHGQTSQAIRVEVPFAFTVNKRIHPAGTYRIDSVSTTRQVWRIRGGSRIRRDEYLLATSVSGSSTGDLRVIFHRYGNKQFLAGFKTLLYEVSVPASRREKVLRQSQEEALVPTEIISLETVTGGSR